MMRLFSSPHFEEIMLAVDHPVPDRNRFDYACQSAGLDTCETDWLWNYLKNCNFAYYGCLPEAAASGW